MTDFDRQQLSLCGIRLDALRGSDLIELIGSARSTHRKLLILNHNLHSLYLYQTNRTFREAYEQASCVYIDGMPVIWLARAAGFDVGPEHRITFLDSFETILTAAAEKGWRVFYLGSTEATLQEGLAKLRSSHPRLIIDGRNGYLGADLQDAPAAIAQVNAFAPDLLFVGMGMPTQELFLARHFADLKTCAALTSGATLDYVTGAAYKPPAWAGPLGLYGVLRLLSSPRRLWRRYLLEPIVLLASLGPAILQQRRGRPLARQRA